MALTMVEGPRADKLLLLAQLHGIEIRDTIDSCETTAEEDVFVRLFHGDPGTDAEPIKRWCAVTSSGEYMYLYPDYDSREEAEARTVEYPDDDIYSESPHSVVDLDGEGLAGDEYRLAKLVAVFSDTPERVTTMPQWAIQ